MVGVGSTSMPKSVSSEPSSHSDGIEASEFSEGSDGFTGDVPDDDIVVLVLVPELYFGSLDGFAVEDIWAPEDDKIDDNSEEDEEVDDAAVDLS